jgi:hypothetical protein
MTHNGSALRCDLCKDSITSQKHRNICNMTCMYQVKKYEMTPDFKPMMTYGLGGCTALLMVFFTKDTNTVHKVVLGHHPNKENILEWFNYYYTENYNIVTIIKTPEEYVKEGGKWITITSNQEYWILNTKKDNCKLITERYGLNICRDEEFQSTLYFKMQQGPKFSDNYGRYIAINYV